MTPDPVTVGEIGLMGVYCVNTYSEPVVIVIVGGGTTTAIVKVAVVGVPVLLLPETV